MKNIIYSALFALLLIGCKQTNPTQSLLSDTLKKPVLEQAAIYLNEKPSTVTDFVAERSEGGIHDFFSEGDYWWPDPENPDGPYIRRDGETNPDNFVAHRHAMVRFSMIVGNLTSAYLLTNDTKYIDAAKQHIRAWFMNEETRMNPSLLYAQAIKGRYSGRGIGIIDTIHLMEVAQSLIRMEEKGLLTEEELNGTKQWFRDYLNWLTTHPYGQDEMKAKNNHGTCWAMQAASFAQYVGDKEILKFCADQYKEVFLSSQMDEKGSFPLELARTKPYGYSLFNLDAMVMLCQILSTPEDDLWTYASNDKKSISMGVAFMYPYIKDKASWPYERDVMYWDEWPVAQPALLFTGVHFQNEGYCDTWAALNHFPTNEEVIRNLPIRNPIIWLY